MTRDPAVGNDAIQARWSPGTRVRVNMANVHPWETSVHDGRTGTVTENRIYAANPGAYVRMDSDGEVPLIHWRHLKIMEDQ